MCSETLESRVTVADIQCSNFYDGQQGDLTYSAGTTLATYPIYGSGYLLQASPNLLCPYYNGTYYFDANNVPYLIYCGFTASGGTDGTGAGITGSYKQTSSMLSSSSQTAITKAETVMFSCPELPGLLRWGWLCQLLFHISDLQRDGEWDQRGLFLPARSRYSLPTVERSFCSATDHDSWGNRGGWGTNSEDLRPGSVLS